MHTPLHSLLDRLLESPGAQNVLLLDHTGDCLAHRGTAKLSPAKITVWSVLARASFNAGDELGLRAESGSCQEITNLHERGGSILRLVPGGKLLVLHFNAEAAPGVLRLAVRQAADELAQGLVPQNDRASELARLTAELQSVNFAPGAPASAGAVLFEEFTALDDESGFHEPAVALCHEG